MKEQAAAEQGLPLPELQVMWGKGNPPSHSGE